MSESVKQAAPSGKRFYYICDGCGNIVTITAAPIMEGRAWQCDECGGEALWEFTNKAHALAHSEHIRRGVRSGIFRKARP